MIPEWMIPTDIRPAKDHPDPDHRTAWRDSIILRDQDTCQLCQRHSDFVGTMDVHHLSYERFGKEEKADGILLCRPCHNEVTNETRRRRYDDGEGTAGA